MCLIFNYQLYFKSKHLWEALQRVVKIAESYNPSPTPIHFTDHYLVLPIATGFRDESKLHQDLPKLNLAISQISKEDDTTLEYMINKREEGAHRSPPDVDGVERI